MSPSGSQGSSACEYFDFASVRSGDVELPNNDPLPPALVNCQGTQAHSHIGSYKKRGLLDFAFALWRRPPPPRKASYSFGTSDRQASSCIESMPVYNHVAEDACDQSISAG